MLRDYISNRARVCLGGLPKAGAGGYDEKRNIFSANTCETVFSIEMNGRGFLCFSKGWKGWKKKKRNLESESERKELSVLNKTDSCIVCPLAKDI